MLHELLCRLFLGVADGWYATLLGRCAGATKALRVLQTGGSEVLMRSAYRFWSGFASVVIRYCVGAYTGHERKLFGHYWMLLTGASRALMQARAGDVRVLRVLHELYMGCERKLFGCFVGVCW